jgi:hypothetical protein
MNVLLVGITLLMLSFCVQLLLWRVWLPARQIQTLLIVFIIAPFVAIAMLTVTGGQQFLPTFSIADIVRLIFFYASCSLVYIILYSAIEERSPTLAIVSYVGNRAGSTEAELFERFGGGDELFHRIELLTLSKFVGRDGDNWHLTPAGRRLAQLFDVAGRLFGLEVGG